MGISSDGIVAFGFPLGNEDFEFPERMTAYLDQNDEDASFDFDDFIAHEAGLADAEYNERREAREKFPVELIGYCSYDYTMHFLAVLGTEHRCCRGEATEFIPTTPNYAALKEFCEKYGLEWKQPGWYVMSMYG